MNFLSVGQKRTDLEWTPSVSGFVDIWRNGAKIEADIEGTTHTDLIGRGGESVYTYKVCVPLTDVCSNEVTVTF